MAKKGNTEKYKLVSSASSHSYTTTRNKRLETKLKLKKYDPKVRRHVVYTEERMKSGKA